MKSFRQLRESTAKVAVITFGRFNPPTTGHQVMVEKMETTAKRYGGDAFLFASSSQDPKKNPLPYNEKINLMKKMFPVKGHNIFKYAAQKSQDVMHAASAIFEDGYQELILVVGSDRVGQFKKLLPQYNGVKDKPHGFYEFSKINIVSAGERDPDGEGATGMSASKMRQFAIDGNVDGFASGMPDTVTEDQKRKAFQSLRKHMRLKVIEAIVRKQSDLEIVTPNASVYDIKEHVKDGEMRSVVDYLYTLPIMKYEKVYVDKIYDIVEELHKTDDYFSAKAQVRVAKKYIDILHEGSGMVDYEFCDLAVFDNYLDKFKKKEYILKPLNDTLVKSTLKEGDFERAALAIGAGIAVKSVYQKWLAPRIKAKFSIKAKIELLTKKIEKLKDKKGSLDDADKREKITDQVAKLEDEVSKLRQKVKSINSDIEKKKARKSEGGKRKTGQERETDRRDSDVDKGQEAIDDNQDKIERIKQELEKFKGYDQTNPKVKEGIAKMQDARAQLVAVNKNLRAKMMTAKKRKKQSDATKEG